MEEKGREFFRCDSCKRLYPKEMMKEVKFSYNVMNSRSKEGLTTETIWGMICPECGKEKPTTTKASTKPYTTKR